MSVNVTVNQSTRRIEVSPTGARGLPGIDLPTDYSAEAAYVARNTVLASNCLFLARRTVPVGHAPIFDDNGAPVSDIYWAVVGGYGGGARGPTGATGEKGDTGDSLVRRGTYDNAAVYEANDAVIYTDQLAYFIPSDYAGGPITGVTPGHAPWLKDASSNAASIAAVAAAEAAASASAAAAVAEIRAPARLEQYVGIASPATGGGVSGFTFMHYESVLFDSYLTDIYLWAVTPGTLLLKVFNSNGTQDGSDIPIAVTATESVHIAGLNIPLAAGQRIGWYGTGVVAFINGNTTARGYYRDITGNVSSVSPTSLYSTNTLQIRFKLVSRDGYVSEVQRRVDAVESVTTVLSQTIGRASPATGTASNARTYTYSTPVTVGGAIGAIRYHALRDGVLWISSSSRSGNNVSQVGSWRKVFCPEGAHTLTPKDFGDIQVGAGEFISFYPDGQWLSFITQAAASAYYNSPGDTTTFPYTDASALSTVDLQISFDIVSPLISPQRLTDIEADVIGLGGDVADLASQLVKITPEIIGRPDAVGSGATVASGTIVFVTPYTITGTLDEVSMHCLSDGVVRVGLYSRDNGTNTCAQLRYVDLTVVAGANHFTAPGDFTALTVNAGDHFGYSNSAGAGAVTFDNSATGDSGGWWRTSSQNSASFVDSTATTDVLIHIQAVANSRVPYDLSALDASTSATPVVTDGRTLQRWRAKVGANLAAAGGILRVMMIGDSWTERLEITQPLCDQLIADYGQSGPGWIDCLGTYKMTGVSYSRANWSTYDVTANGPPISGIGSSFDGKAIYTTGLDATCTITVKCQAFKIWYRDLNGIFRYRVDGGAWTEVIGGNTGAKMSVSPLTAATDAFHTIEIDTSTNTGGRTVALYGFRATRTAAGVEFNKCGNVSLDGAQASSYINDGLPEMSDIAPDLVIIILATNDYTRSKGFDTFTTGVTDMINLARAAVPDCSIVLWAPSQTSAVAVIPLSRYVDELYRLSQVYGAEFFNHYALFGTYAQSNALGLMTDTLHLSTSGGYAATRSLKRRLLDT